ncbi:hypothetical protein TARUN_10081 [Trichoderma arundinaceum]|uniref:Uncharacterized protein n=1 Tax=Trichoderma arundinaceum TaxID=490622 RepID=A0A395N842_TRIAR|nr:hypothetical protein TARUN_10081 [Trichoderma arundinaceum]
MAVSGCNGKEQHPFRAPAGVLTFDFKAITELQAQTSKHHPKKTKQGKGGNRSGKKTPMHTPLNQVQLEAATAAPVGNGLGATAALQQS